MLEASQVFDAIRTHLRAHAGHLECFGQYQFQAEGWLKAELVMLLNIMKTRGEIVDLDREIKAPPGGRIDLAFDLPGERHWVELKHYLIGKQKGQTWGLKAYMPYLTDELEKLDAVRAGESGWIVVLCTQNPGIESWDTAINQFNHANAPWALVSQDVPSNYPASYFLGVLRTERLAAPQELAPHWDRIKSGNAEQFLSMVRLRSGVKAEPGTGADAQQPPLLRRFSHWARLTASVRLSLSPNTHLTENNEIGS